MKTVAVLTSGGDAPGMNAAIRAVVRSSVDRGWNVFGVRHGYAGLMSGDFVPMGARSVGGIVQHGGTILGSSRSPEFRTKRGRLKALRHLRERNIDALIAIGGNGTQAGALALFEMRFPVVGIASTIDNDLSGTEISIGVDTALNVALEAIDRLKVTASSHQRAFVVEVMGRKCGYLAMMAGLAGGAEAVIVPEFRTNPRNIAVELRSAYDRGKTHAFVVVAEGAYYNAERLTHFFKQHGELGFTLRVTTLGHVQRGGTPTVFDRLLGSRLGFAATETLANGTEGVLVGWARSEVVVTKLKQVAGVTKPLDPRLFELARILAK